MRERRRYNGSGLGKSMWKVGLVCCCLFLYRRRSTGLGGQILYFFQPVCLHFISIVLQPPVSLATTFSSAQTANCVLFHPRLMWLKCFSSGDWQLLSRPFFSLFLPICIFTSCHPWTWGVVDVYASSRMKTTTHPSSVSRPTSSKSQRTLLPVSHFNTFGVTVLSPEYIRWSQNHSST